MPLDDKPRDTGKPKDTSSVEDFELEGSSAQAKRQLTRDETVDTHVEPVTFERETIAPNITFGTRLVEGNEEIFTDKSFHQGAK